MPDESPRSERRFGREEAEQASLWAWVEVREDETRRLVVAILPFGSNRDYITLVSTIEYVARVDMAELAERESKKRSTRVELCRFDLAEVVAGMTPLETTKTAP